MKVLFQLNMPIKQIDEAGFIRDYYQVAGVFEADDENTWATTIFGNLVIPRKFIEPCVLFLNEDFDLTTLNRDLVLVVNE